MFMVCSNVAKSAIPVKPQGNGVMRDERTPSLDVRDVKTAAASTLASQTSRGSAGRFMTGPNRQIMCQNPHNGLNFLSRRRYVINSI
jgi:hypothetical protein